MRVIPNGSSVKLPGAFRELVGMMPPQAIMDEVHYGLIREKRRGDGATACSR